MAINDFTGKNIQDTYQRVVQTDGTNLADGTGSLLPISFDGNNVIISGSLTAQTYVVSESITNITSGSTIFGNTPDDTHTFTGAITASGNISASGDIIGNKLHIPNNEFLGSFLTHNKLTIHESDSNLEAASIEGSGTKGTLTLRYQNSPRIFLDPIINSYINTAGNFGIGDSTPSYKLDVAGTGRFTGALLVNNTITGTANSTFGAASGGGNLNTHTFIGNITASNNISASGFIQSSHLKGNTALPTGLVVEGYIDAQSLTVPTIFHTDLIIGEDSQTAIDFGTPNEIDFKINNATELTLDATALYPTVDAGLDLGKSSLEFKDAFFDGTVTSDAFAGPLTGDVTGKADTADTLETSRNIAMTGDVTWNVDFIGDSNETAAGTIAANAVTTAKIAADAITSAKIADNAVGNEHLGDNAVDTAEIAADAITSAKIADDAIEEEHIGDGEVKTAALADDAVTLAKMANDAVDEANLKVSNTPTNGYFLSAQSGNTGGLTWAAAGGASGAQTGITTITNAALKLARDTHNFIDFGTDDQIKFTVSTNQAITFKATGEIEATKFDGALEGNADTATNLVASTSTGVQLGTIEIGHASDTTIARASAGQITVEGTAVLLAGAQTGITSLLATDIKIGEDDQTKIDFETADEIHLYAANAEQVYVADGILGPETDSDVDLGTNGVRFKDAYVDTVTSTGNVSSGGFIIAKTPMIQLNTTDDSTDIYTNSATQISWNKQEIIDTDYFTHAHTDTSNDHKIIVDTAGRYEVHFIIVYNASGGGGVRATPQVRINVNGASTLYVSNSGYLRRVSGCNHSSTNGTYVVECDANDYISISSMWASGFGANASSPVSSIYMSRPNSTTGFSRLTIKKIG